MSVKTVEKHRANLMSKLDLHNTAALTTFALENTLLPPVTPRSRYGFVPMALKVIAYH